MPKAQADVGHCRLRVTGHAAGSYPFELIVRGIRQGHNVFDGARGPLEQGSKTPVACGASPCGPGA